MTRTLGSNVRPGTSPPVPPSLQPGKWCRAGRSPLLHAPHSEPGLWGEEEGGTGRPAWAASPFLGASPGPDGRPGGDELRPEKETEGCPRRGGGDLWALLDRVPRRHVCFLPWMQLRDHRRVGQHPFTMRAKVRDAWREDPEPGSTGPAINQPQDPRASQLYPRAPEDAGPHPERAPHTHTPTCCPGGSPH